MEDSNKVPTISTGLNLMPIGIEAKLHLCDILVKSKLVPVKTKEEGFAILAYGHELGYGPMEAFQKIYVVNGKPGLFANALLEKARKHPEFAGVKIESDKTHAKITLKRKAPNAKETEEMIVTFTEEDAKRAGLVKDGSGYKKYPERMYRARVISWAVRDLFPDAANNMMSVEELKDIEYEKEETVETITIDLGTKDDDGKPILEAIQITKSYEEIAKYFKNEQLTKEQKTMIAKGIKNNRAPTLIKNTVEKWLETTEEDRPKEEEEKKEPPKSEKDVTEKQDKKLKDLLKTHVLTEEEKEKLNKLADDKEGASTAIEIALNDMKKRKEIEKFIRGLVKGIPELTAENLKTLQEKPSKQSDLRDYIANEKLDLNSDKFNKKIKGALAL